MADIGEVATGVATVPTGGVVYDNTKQYVAQLRNTFQQNIQDPIGATIGNGEGRLPTYSYATVGYVPYASAFDVLTIIGSATTLVRVRRIAISGRSTSASNIDVGVFKRTVLNTGGNPTTLVAVLHDIVINPAATAIVQTYGSSPTIAGGTGVLFRAQQSNLSAAGSGGAATPVEFDFGTAGGQSAVLRNATEAICVSLGGSTPTGTVLNLWVETTEE